MENGQKLQNLYSSPFYYSGDQIKDALGRACGTHGRSYAYNILVGKPQEKRPFTRSLKEENIKMDLNETGCEGVNWIHLG
jgi:hypothetical protein